MKRLEFLVLGNGKTMSIATNSNGLLEGNRRRCCSLFVNVLRSFVHDWQLQTVLNMSLAIKLQ